MSKKSILSIRSPDMKQNLIGPPPGFENSIMPFGAPSGLPLRSLFSYPPNMMPPSGPMLQPGLPGFIQMQMPTALAMQMFSGNQPPFPPQQDYRNEKSEKQPERTKGTDFRKMVEERAGIQRTESKPSHSKIFDPHPKQPTQEIEDPTKEISPDDEILSKRKADIRQMWAERIGAAVLRGDNKKADILKDACNDVVDFALRYGDKIREEVLAETQRQLSINPVESYNIPQGSYHSDGFIESISGDAISFNNRGSRNTSTESPIVNESPSNSVVFDNNALRPSFSTSSESISVKNAGKFSNSDEDEEFRRAVDQINSLLSTSASPPKPEKSIEVSTEKEKGKVTERRVRNFGRESPGFRGDYSNQQEFTKPNSLPTTSQNYKPNFLLTTSNQSTTSSASFYSCQEPLAETPAKIISQSANSNSQDLTDADYGAALDYFDTFE